MKIFVKTISFILVCTMLISALFSCTSVSNSSANDSKETSDSQAPVSDDASDSESEQSNVESDAPTSSDTENPDTADTDATDTESASDKEGSDFDVTTEESDTESESQEATDTESEESTESDIVLPEAENFPKNSFPILGNGKYVVQIVVSSEADAEDRFIANELRAALKEKTNVEISYKTDLVLNESTYDSNCFEIIIGCTNHEASKSVYASSSYNAYGAKVVGKNKIVFFFSTKAEGIELVEQFQKSIRSNDEGQYWVSSTLSLINTIDPNLTLLPKFPEPDSKLSTVDCYDDTKMVVVTNTTLEKFNTYCNTLKSSKFVEYSKRENIDGNYFRIYTQDDIAINAYFSNGRKQARIIIGPLKDIPSKEKDTTPETNKKPTLTMIGPSESTENGLALIYHLPNGKFLVIDGGYNLSDRLYKEFRELQPTGDIVVAGWFMSHPHGDHQESLEVVIEQHGHEIEIENIYFNYLHPEYYDDITGDSSASAKEGHSVTRLRELISKKLSRKTNIVKPHTGQIYTFGSATVEIISTIEDYLPGRIDNINTSSMIVRVNVEGTTTMVLADATSTLNDILLAMYNSHLESNIVTLAHHGIWVDTPEMYTRVSAEVLLWPSNTKRAQEFYHGNREPSYTTYSKPAINEALKQATDVFLARGTDTVLSLPYKTVGNKQDFINNVLN